MNELDDITIKRVTFFTNLTPDELYDISNGRFTIIAELKPWREPWLATSTKRILVELCGNQLVFILHCSKEGHVVERLIEKANQTLSWRTGLHDHTRLRSN